MPNNPRLRLSQLIVAAFAALTLILNAACGEVSPTQGTPQPASSSETRTTAGPTRTPQVDASSFTGTLDTSFGKGGKVNTNIGGSPEEAVGAIVQADGKIVVLGEAWPKTKAQFAFTRYDSEGNLDTTFGEDGKLVVNVTGSEYDYSEPHALIQQPDGKYIAVGTTLDFDAGHLVFAALRYNADGSPDESFGEGGKALVAVDQTEGSSSEEEAHAVALAPDGKILLAGMTGRYPHSFGTVRLNADGTLDESFGDGGRVVTSFPNDAMAHAVAVQPDGKVLVGGYGSDDPSTGMEGHDYTLVRYNEDGSLDEEFGTDGVAMTDFRQNRDYIEALLVLPGGKIVAAGPVYIDVTFCETDACASPGFGLAQYNPDGTPDDSFGGDGKVGYRQGTDLNYDVVRLPDGKLLTAGSIDDNDAVALMLLNPDGTKVESFGDEGLVATQFDKYHDIGLAMTVQPDGKVVVVGSATLRQEDMFDTDFAVIRYK
ncbi:MAG: delta-60 repeat domain-containing protein [Chloroflexota bacterium]|nr:delta-60 repeat domain-containing protein [Chloroflexota bacterium]MDQ5864383.1 delta-60 repeat domain-containing protein [Chloroflexota bacterium]